MTGCILADDVMPATSDQMRRLLWLWSLEIAADKQGCLATAINHSFDHSYRSPWKA